MRHLVVFCAIGIIACAPADDQPPADAPAAAPTLALADLAGTWTVDAMTEAGDSTRITYELTATETSDGWASVLPGREPTPVRVMLVDGDSVVLEAGPFESALRPGTMVSTRTVARLQGGMLMGTMVAHYATEDADSVVRGRVHGMRQAP